MKMMISSATSDISKILEKVEIFDKNENENNVVFSKNEREILLKHISKVRPTNFFSKYKNLTPQKLFNKLNNDNVCKCLFCQNVARFISIFKGYGQTCSNKECTRKLFLKNNVETKNFHRQQYSEFVLNNLEFYKNVEFPFVDIYDNRIIKSLGSFKKRIFLKLFDRESKCIFCKQKIIINLFSKNPCICHSCNKGHLMKYYDDYKKFSEIDFKLYLLNLKLKKFSNSKLLELSRKYTFEQIKNLLYDHAIIFNNYFLQRPQVNSNFSFIFNKIYEPDMFNTCAHCGKKYIKYDKIIKDGKLQLIQTGATFSCSRKCYNKCISLYEQSDEYRKNLSNKLKKAIAEGRFTPNITNSWTHSKKFKIDNIKFRSSWEFLFYIIECKIKKNKLDYEKVRIPYIIDGNTRNYIVDFSNKTTLFEIKPNSCKTTEKNILKFDAALKYCKENNKSFRIIDENYFKLNYNDNVFSYIPDDLKDYCKKLWRCFE